MQLNAPRLRSPCASSKSTRSDEPDEGGNHEVITGNQEAIRVARAERVGGGGNDEAEHPHSSAAHAAADPASLASAMHMQSEMRHALVAQHARVIDLFRQWDMNGDGRIRKRELRKALAALGYHVPPYMCDADEL